MANEPRDQKQPTREEERAIAWRERQVAEREERERNQRCADEAAWRINVTSWGS